MCQLKELIQTARTESTSRNHRIALIERPTRIARLRLERKEWPKRIICDGSWNGEVFYTTRITIEVVVTEII